MQAIAPYIARAQEQRDRPLGVNVRGTIRTIYGAESPLGNLLADLMLRARPTADFAVINGGGIRTDLQAGPLTYGKLYEIFPFDNRFAFVRVSGAELRKILYSNSRHDAGILSVAGLRVVIHPECQTDPSKAVELFRSSGRPIRDDEQLTLLASDYLVTGGERTLTEIASEEGRTTIEDGAPLRDAVATQLEHLHRTLRENDRRLFNPARRRWSVSGGPLHRPFHCTEAQ